MEVSFAKMIGSYIMCDLLLLLLLYLVLQAEGWGWFSVHAELTVLLCGSATAGWNCVYFLYDCICVCELGYIDRTGERT